MHQLNLRPAFLARPQFTLIPFCRGAQQDQFRHDIALRFFYRFVRSNNFYATPLYYRAQFSPQRLAWSNYNGFAAPLHCFSSPPAPAPPPATASTSNMSYLTIRNHQVGLVANGVADHSYRFGIQNIVSMYNCADQRISNRRYGPRLN